MSKRRSQAAGAADTVLPELRRLYSEAARVARDWPSGFCARYRRERRRLLGIAYRAARKAAQR